MTITKKDKESKEPNTIKKVLKKHLKEDHRVWDEFRGMPVTYHSPGI